MKITFKTLGAEATVECNDGANCSQAIETFERLMNKSLNNMDFFVNNSKVQNPEDISLEDGDVITAVKSKHESAAKITFKTLGFEATVECDGDDVECTEAMETFERLTSKSLSNMDLFVNNSKVQDLDSQTLSDGDVVTAVKSKHESA